MPIICTWLVGQQHGADQRGISLEYASDIRVSFGTTILGDSLNKVSDYGECRSIEVGMI